MIHNDVSKSKHNTYLTKISHIYPVRITTIDYSSLIAESILLQFLTTTRCD